MIDKERTMDDRTAEIDAAINKLGRAGGTVSLMPDGTIGCTTPPESGSGTGQG